MRTIPALAALVLTGILIPTAAFAHPGHIGSLDVVAGLAHPLSGLDHIAAMLGAGFLAAMLGRRGFISVPLAFLAALVVGFGLGTAQVGLPLIEATLAMSGVALVGFGFIARRLRTGLAVAASAGFALVHGVAHGLEMPASVDALGFALGFVGASAALVGLGFAATRAVLHRGARKAA
jgi:urease accessory protein